MKNLYLLFIAVLGLNMSVLAQDVVDITEYDDLRVMLMDEDYEKLVKKAVAITENDKRKKEPMPYLFASMAYYEMSKDEQYAEDYPKAFDLALKYAAKYRTKDKGSDYVDSNRDYIDDVRAGAMEVGENYAEEEKWSKAKRYYKYITKIDPEDAGAWLMRGYTELKGNDRSGAKTSLGKYANLDLGNFDSWSSDQQRLLKYALLTYSEHLYQNGMKDSASVMITAGEQYFTEDKEYNMAVEDFK